MKRVNANVKNVLLCSIFLSVVACSGSGGDENVKTLNEIPRIMAPVSQSVSASSVKISEARTGLNLYEASSTSFPIGSSNGMCQMTNLVKNLLDDAAKVDKIKCYVDRVMVTNGLEDSAAIYDGKAHIFMITFTGRGEIEKGKVQLQIEKVDENNISSFSMKNCFGADGGATQTESLLYKIGTDKKVSVTSKQKKDTWQSYITVDGELDGNSKYKSKTIVAKSIGAYENNVNSSKGTINQYSDALIFNGFNTGTWGGHNYQNRMYSKLELKNGDSSELHEIGIGDGSASFIMTGDDWPGNSAIESWNGDTNKTLTDKTSGMYYSAVLGQTPEAIEEVTIPDFTGDEAWDCSGTPEYNLTETKLI